MNETTKTQEISRSGNERTFTLGETIDAYMAGYEGRDGSMAAKLRWVEAATRHTPTDAFRGEIRARPFRS